MELVQLTDLEKVSLGLMALDGADNEVDVVLDAGTKWVVDDESLLSLVVAEDGLSAVATTTGKLGTAFVTVHGFVNGVELPEAELEVDVVTSGVAKLEIVVGVIEKK